MALQWEVGLTAARTCFSPPTSSLHSTPGTWSTSLRGPSCGDPKEAPSISCIHHWQCGHNWPRSTHGWGGGACSVAFIPVKIEYMQAICTMELHAMKFLIVCTFVWIWHYVACPKEWVGLGLSSSQLYCLFGAQCSPLPANPRFYETGEAPASTVHRLPSAHAPFSTILSLKLIAHQFAQMGMSLWSCLSSNSILI